MACTRRVGPSAHARARRAPSRTEPGHRLVHPRTRGHDAGITNHPEARLGPSAHARARRRGLPCRSGPNTVHPRTRGHDSRRTVGVGREGPVHPRTRGHDRDQASAPRFAAWSIRARAGTTPDHRMRLEHALRSIRARAGTTLRNYSSFLANEPGCLQTSSQSEGERGRHRQERATTREFSRSQATQRLLDPPAAGNGVRGRFREVWESEAKSRKPRGSCA